MQKSPLITTARMEAFSDGVIAILITIMVFDLKLNELPTELNVWKDLQLLLPKFISYALSFLVIAIMWINHHHLLHQVSHTDHQQLWYNILLLFFMSLIPFATNFIGSNPLLAQSSLVYGLIFAGCSVSFFLLRHHAATSGKMPGAATAGTATGGARRKNFLSIGLYLAGAGLAFSSVYLSFICFVLVPALYFFPQRIQAPTPASPQDGQ
ncbi:MAG TPA: TMEM175 family protein [Lacibacter sp.]|nr:TMEM175 family protein [Lacibacter sp.]